MRADHKDGLVREDCEVRPTLQPSAYEVESKVEESHWWFAGRRRLLARVIADMALSRDARVLDVGSGTGANLRLLRELGFRNVTGVDSSEHAIRFCAEKGLADVEKGDACALPCEDQSVDLVLATDIVEHLDDDSAALREFRRVLRPGGCAVLTVPAFPGLWGLQDDVSHHKRRYRRRDFEARIARAGLDLRTSFYFNYLLFAPIWIARRCIRAFRVELDSENQINTSVMNALLARLFAFDVWSAAHVHPFFGVSLFALTERRRHAEPVG